PLGHSKISKLASLSIASVLRRKLHRPNKSLFAYNTPALAANLEAPKSLSTPARQHAWDPRTVSRGGPRSVPACCGLVHSNQWPGPVPKQQELSDRGLDGDSEAFRLRRPPADKSVKSEKGEQ